MRSVWWCVLLLGCSPATNRHPLPRDAGSGPDAGAVGCDDANACTVDRCEGGHESHASVSCAQPEEPCQRAFCDPATGCGAAAVPDGTPCDPNRCSTVEQRTCLAGRCVISAAPAGTRCEDQWASLRITTRVGHAMAYDSDRGVTVLFGGMAWGGDFDTFHDDTWEWDGAGWSRRVPAHHPLASKGASMIYDPVKKRVVLFGGGTVGGPWEWDGTDWTELSPAHRPPARRYAGFVYDGDRHVAVLFGGEINADVIYADDTWEWDGTDWTQRFPLHSPDRRSKFGMAYDPTRKVTVLYGGFRPGVIGADTWVWNGDDWAKGAPDEQGFFADNTALMYFPPLQRVVIVGQTRTGWPATRSWNGSAWEPVTTAHLPDLLSYLFGQVVFDERRAEGFLFGGAAVGWRFDGADWVPAELQPMPVARAGAAAAFDGVRHQVVMFGGSEESLFGSAEDADTWAWDGLAWQPLAPEQSPGARVDHMLVRDPDREVLVLFGGRDGAGAYRNDTWEWDGHSWNPRRTAHAPPPRVAGSIAYDRARRKVVVFGGMANPVLFSDTWEWDGVDWVERTFAKHPSERAGAAMVFDPHSRQLLLFGGGDGYSPPQSDTWRYDGAGWTQLFPAHSPSARMEALAAEDLRRSQVVLYGGGTESEGFRDTWGWDGEDWFLRGPVGAPDSSAGAVFAFDPDRDEFVLFGGGRTWSYASSDTWLFYPPDAPSSF